MTEILSKPTASLLLIVTTDADRRLYSQPLEEAGYKVRPAASLKEVEQACNSSRFDLILVADKLDLKIKKAVAAAIRYFFPDAPILQIGRTRPDIEGHSFVTGRSPEDVLRSVKQILSQDDIRPAAI